MLIRGSGKGHEDQVKVQLRKSAGCLGVLPRKGGEQNKENRVMAHIQEGRLFEGGGHGRWVTCHQAWGQLFLLEVDEELCYEGKRGSKAISLSFTAPSTENPPLSVINGLDGWDLRGCNTISLENPSSLSDLLTASRHGAAVSVGPGGICLTLIV